MARTRASRHPLNARAHALAGLALIVAARLAAQGTPGASPVITGHDFRILGAAALGTAAMSVFDVRVARLFGNPAMHRQRKLDVMARRTSSVTETLLMISGGSVWAIARLGHSDGTADVALHTTESVASGAAFIQIIRGVAGRSRPYVVDDSGETHDSDPYEFQWLHGFTSFNYRSFPSMHAMASFAAATALSEEMTLRQTRYRQVISPLLYVAASASPLARMYLDEHWSSDIALGAFLGVFAGQKVVRYSHQHPDNFVDRKLLGRELRVGIARDGHGVSVLFSPF